MGIVKLVLVLVTVASVTWSFGALAEKPDKRIQVASQFLALAPNAGGQDVYGLKISKEKWEFSLFSNQSIYAGGYPYSGIVLHRRFFFCDASCFWQFFSSIGAGGSNGGPIGEVSWGAVFPLVPLWLPLKAPSYVPAIRIDITTQLVFIRWRAVTWSYPFWVGFSVPM